MFWFNSEDAKAKFAAASHGLGRERINLSDLRATQVPIAPLSEQRRIVAKIDSLSAKSRRARDQLDRIPMLVEKYKQAILDAALTGDLTKEWRTRTKHDCAWHHTCIGNLLTDIRYGTSKKCDYGSRSTAVLRIPNVQFGSIVLEDLKYADFTQNELNKLRLQTGDILVIRSNGSLDLVGRSAVVDNQAAGMLFAGYLIRLRLKTEIVHPAFLQYHLQAAATRARIEQLAKSTSGVNNINSAEIQQLEVSVPPMHEQREIVRRVDAAFVWVDRLAKEAMSAHKLIDHLNQAILTKALRGDLMPQDPDDETASVLLERIKAERIPTTQAGSRRKGQVAHRNWKRPCPSA
jgi:type I restriction enzyme S subunit